MQRQPVLRLLTAAFLLVAGCGDGGDRAGDGTTSTGSTTSTTSAGRREPVEGPGELATCSASGLSPSPVEQPKLPEPVRAMREAIVEAAVACDVARLEELAARGPGTFTYSFGGDSDPGGYWLAQEADERGPDPLRFLVELLDRPYRQIDHDHLEQSQFVWPSAFAYESWSEVPEREQQALEPLYTEEDFAGFEDFGGYIGYRVGITPEGDWIFFVAGD